MNGQIPHDASTNSHLPIPNANILQSANLWPHKFESQMCSEPDGFTPRLHMALSGTVWLGTLQGAGRNNLPISQVTHLFITHFILLPILQRKFSNH